MSRSRSSPEPPRPTCRRWPSWRPACASGTSSAGPFEGLGKDELPGQLCAFTAGVLRAEARHEPGYYDAIHSHYWLSGQVGWLARERWGVPLVHTAHTLAKVKNLALAEGDAPEPRMRVIGEEQVVDEADRLVANTDIEASELIKLYDAEPSKVAVVPPGVDLDRFTPGDQARARHELRHPARRGRAGVRRPDPAAEGAGRAAARGGRDAGAGSGAAVAAGRADRRRAVRQRAGAAEGAARSWPRSCRSRTWCGSCRRSRGPRSREVYRAADLVAVPSYNESFGLVALEAQACGTPVVAAAVGGLPVAVNDGVSGVLVARARARGRGPLRSAQWRCPSGSTWRATRSGMRDASRGTARLTRCWRGTRKRPTCSAGRFSLERLDVSML